MTETAAEKDCELANDIVDLFNAQNVSMRKAMLILSTMVLEWATQVHDGDQYIAALTLSDCFKDIAHRIKMRDFQ